MSVVGNDGECCVDGRLSTAAVDDVVWSTCDFSDSVLFDMHCELDSYDIITTDCQPLSACSSLLITETLLTAGLADANSVGEVVWSNGRARRTRESCRPLISCSLLTLGGRLPYITGIPPSARRAGDVTVRATLARLRWCWPERHPRRRRCRRVMTSRTSFLSTTQVCLELSSRRSSRDKRVTLD